MKILNSKQQNRRQLATQKPIKLCALAARPAPSLSGLQGRRPVGSAAAAAAHTVAISRASHSCFSEASKPNQLTTLIAG